MAYLAGMWSALSSGPLERILQHLTQADCEALQAFLHQLPARRQCRLQDGLAPLQAWDPSGAAQKGDLAALRYWHRHLQHIRPKQSFTRHELVHLAARAMASGDDNVALQCADWGANRDALLEQAARAGRSKLVRAFRQGASSPRIIIWAMQSAAQANQVEALQMLKEGVEIGSNERAFMLNSAASGGAAEAAQLCISWGVTQDALGAAMALAAQQNATGVMQLCKTAGGAASAKTLEGAISGGVRVNHEGRHAALKLCISWGVTKAALVDAINRSLYNAVQCRLSYSTATPNQDTAMYWDNVAGLLTDALQDC